MDAAYHVVRVCLLNRPSKETKNASSLQIAHCQITAKQITVVLISENV